MGLIRFGAFELDRKSRELRKDGRSTGLPDQSIEVLSMLLERPGEVVFRDEIRLRLWPNDTVVEFDHSINTAIRKLRLALGESADTPKYIETLARRGYRWIGPVEESPSVNTGIAATGSAPEASSLRHVAGTLPRRRLLWVALVSAVLAALAITRLFTAAQRIVPVSPAESFFPPPHSIAVLPFVNITGDKEQDYFSDGLTEELLNSLAAIDGLQVAARTSSFSFKEHPDIVAIAHKLNVAAVLEGSVRRSEHTVRVTAQLIDAVTGFHLWSKTYDRDLGDVLKLQTEIATAVAEALKVTLLEDAATKIELGGTRDPAAFDAYLRASKVYLDSRNEEGVKSAITLYSEAIQHDPNYALALANRSILLTYSAVEASGPDARESFRRAQSDARAALALAPDLVEGHLALAYNFEAGLLDFARANQEYDRALALAPGNARVLRDYATFAVPMGRIAGGIAAARRAVVLDPLNYDAHHDLGWMFYYERHNTEAIAAFQDTLALAPDDPETYALRGLAYYALGDMESARASCESKPDLWKSQHCLALTYDKLGRHTDAEAALAKVRATRGDRGAYLYATIEAQRGNVPKAVEWLDVAMRWRDPALEFLKSDPLLDPLRKEPRFQAIERELKFPD